MGTITLEKLAAPAYVPNSAGAVFTNPASTKTYIRLIVLHNGNTTTENVRLYNVPNSGGAVGTAGVSNIFENLAIVANDTVQLEFLGPGLVLTATNDTIQAVTDTASKVVVQIMGAKEV